MGMIGQHLLNGMMQGTIYGLVAMGFTIFFGVMNVIKFSHGDVLTLGAFGGLVAVWATHSLGLSVPMQFVAAFAAAMLLSAVAGAGISHFLIMPLRNAPPLNMLLMTMMVGTVLREAIRLFFPNGTNPQRFPELLPSGGFNIGSSFFRTDALILIVAGIASIGVVYWIINRTKFGLAMRAVAEDVETARTMGINFARVIPLTFALGSITAGFAGTIYGLYYSEINYGMGLLLAVIGFTAAIVGGLGNIWGAIVGGYLFAGLQTFVVAAIPSMSDYKNVFAFVLIIMLITWRPTGLLAERGSERV
ncbi:branched-chain amino acid ABC transporter permease [Bradyrhizobium sp. KBS0727]|uniref:branched-chain amino acid ABC transporter permease n=1 Tax=unclassified Bradyrhizobium TaxID=2631580 RepID=UPI00110EB657|nr:MULTISPECIES: branched-chain amino acid ABC transporter permease [unclassified Bradyrhizobium]QDW37234.1 branched-chain amino acid ABC transporter permease [Bradyrhizobium sp. KBS0725]QDW43836.1 branched-chain amino acid ABC transporter permease [Bradyrhizobium sp. KBS0727]